MKSDITKSTLDAALLIAKNNQIISQNKSFNDYYLSSVDYKSGDELYVYLGGEVFNRYNETKENLEKIYIRREILSKFFKKKKPNSLIYLQGGPIHFLNKLSIDLNQLFEDALLAPNQNQKMDKNELENVKKWWDELSQFARSIVQDKKLDSGRTGEDKTIKYEKKKLKSLNIKLDPMHDGFWDNKLGYDIQSWNKKLEKIFIEAKSSSQENGKFYISKNEWTCAMAKKQSYFVQIWIKDNISPKIMPFNELENHVMKYEKISGNSDDWQTLIIKPLISN